ncbi:MAG: 2-hydroxychromene-2-carboxylate isomerase [Rubrivivax sp.]|nr:2-hydroxychromene-2-carboxylate isomerase [Rubrivivax sp.]
MASEPTLEFFFFIGSTYSHLSVHRAEALAREAGVALVWRPFSVRTLMREQNNIPFAGKPVKTAYMWRDLERRARRFGVPFDGIAPYPIDADERANRVATLAAMQGWCPDFTRAAYRAWFLDKQDPGRPEVLARILAGLGRDAAACLEAADGDAVRADYARQTDRARALGLFGSPSFVHGSEVFWGDDRLDDAIAWALAQSGG